MRLEGNLKRMLVVVGIAWALALGAFLVLRNASNGSAGPTQDEMADSIGAQVMEHLYRGHVSGTSAEITLVPRPHRYMAFEWDLTTLGSGEPDTFTSHPNPWAYLARVPLVLYGPKLNPERTEIEAPVDLGQIAATYAGFLGMVDFEADGDPLPGVAMDDGVAPGAIVTVVIDGGGRNLLDKYPDSWPTIDKLSRRGVSYTNATNGSAPSLTGAVHPTIGTGFYPVHHGIPTNPTWNVDNLRRPTVSELWDEANDNVPVIAATAFESTHLGMIGRGNSREGGDQDIAVLWDKEQSSWTTSGDVFALPEYLAKADLGQLATYEEKLDQRDGSEDNLWFGHDLDELRDQSVRPGTPAFVRLNADAALDILVNENIGQDEITDFLWIEMKMPDYAGHQWNMVNPEVGDVLLAVDEQIRRLKKALSKATGGRGYVLAVTADHGQEPLAEASGGWRINGPELERDLTVRFGDVVDAVTTIEVDVDTESLENEGVALEDLVQFIGDYPLGENIPSDAPGADLVPEDRLNEKLFAGAFTTDYLSDLSTEKIESLGASEYPEGRLSTTGE